ncbi:BatA domain-containing protein [Pelagicoccus sp. SDUM812005]|uniref:BatA domain-containing protein n=1 Tax=Pelagicoccus sp. SDUM812005 TaxID=3041257 RepID=UPI00280F0B23|nr:BatA domain-containing protein [Pelagicoccus sp. SDUM812005]MDQ8182631.1 BatA domain-containing protein [Pelagicoccus sp. SDUM812005]
MNLYLANPLGLLALLAIPPLVYLHFFRRQTRRSIVNTLFLVDKSAVNREAGNLWDKWRHSASFWLQLIGLLLLCWLLSEPRWANSQAVGKVAFVLDSSASMAAFREEAERELGRLGSTLEKRLPATEFYLLESAGLGGALYRGRSLADLRSALESWQPRAASHSPAARLGDARELVGRDGFVVFVSDRPATDLPDGVESLLVGKPLENVGVAGVRVFQRDSVDYWRAIVGNYGRETATRDWWLEFEGGRSPSQSIEIAAGKSLVLEGRFPAGESAVGVALSGDAFELDDYAPIVVEQAKGLSVWIEEGDGNAALFKRLAGSMASSRVTAERERADLEMASLPPGQLSSASKAGIYFVESGGAEEAKIASGVKVPSNHRYNAGLSWEGLYLKGGLREAFAAGDQVLLWMDSEALIFLRGEALVFNFELGASNLDRLPAFVLLVGRHFDSLRKRKPVFEAVNCDVGQVLDLPLSPESGAVMREWRVGETDTVTRTVSSQARAPLEARFFEVEQAGNVLLRGAARFADVRESNFSDAYTEFDYDAFDSRVVEAYYDDDFYSSFWLLCLGGVMLAAWAACHRENL